MSIILGIDPGTATVAWALVDGTRCLDTGHFRTKDGDPWPPRRKHFAAMFAALLKEAVARGRNMERAEREEGKGDQAMHHDDFESFGKRLDAIERRLAEDDAALLAGVRAELAAVDESDGLLPSVGCPDEDAALSAAPHHKPLLVYIAGPYTGHSVVEIDRNVAEAQAAGIAVMQRGHHVICPHTMMHHWDTGTGLGYEAFIRATLALLERCDAVLMVGDWRDSAGARGELERARELGLRVWYTLDEVPDVKGVQGDGA